MIIKIKHPKQFASTNKTLIVCLWVLLLTVFLTANTALAKNITVDAAQERITIQGLSSEQLNKLALLTNYELRKIISVYISDDYFPESTIALGIIGRVNLDKNGLAFIPDKPFERHQQYLLTFSLLPIKEVLIHEEFFTIRSQSSEQITAKPLDYIFHALKLSQDLTPPAQQAIFLRPFANVVNINGLSPSQLAAIAQLRDSERKNIVTVFAVNRAQKDLESDENNNVEKRSQHESTLKKINGDIMLTEDEIKFIPSQHLINRQPYFLVLSLAPIRQVLHYEEAFYIRTTENRGN